MFCPKCGIDMGPTRDGEVFSICARCGSGFRITPASRGRRKVRTLPIVTTEGLGFAETIERPEDRR